jgi:DNA-binding response OmpR family regulator
MKALFFGQDVNKIEQLALTSRIRWPDLESIMVSRGSHGLMAIEQKEPDIAFICEDLTDMSMFSTISEIRKFSDIPIVALTGEDEMQCVKVLDRGGDDYITPSTSMMVMMVKVVAIMRRFNLANLRVDEGPIYCGDLVIDPATYEVYLGSTSLRLTPTEFRLLHLLARNRHITLSHNRIMDEIWSDDVDGSNKVKKYIKRLRRKLDDDAKNPRWMKTVHGMGYRLSPPVLEE